MATPLYDALVTKVRSWVNRDSNILTDTLVGDFLDYSADYCYRTIKSPPFEETFNYAAILMIPAASNLCWRLNNLFFF